ncbi:hypothetical protein PN36_29335 [Candidatus Thiomargarita nelsonii]|uniref:Uncharacterized protein n=1 Tax=Candidatus Thiomargarita nelsonii TaxID=1003181 RepID=A0A4E0QXI2_9GAMM|nr:hypothetical protein PN36_29335 [Candidatus Thiomargarita nelsonii]
MIILSIFRGYATLTRDIELSDAIFDLLDNCVDGLLRTVTHLKSKKPYQGFWASIDFKEGKFTISDNCGGIPIERAEKDAFAMGNPKHDSHLPTLGMYESTNKKTKSKNYALYL